MKAQEEDTPERAELRHELTVAADAALSHWTETRWQELTLRTIKLYVAGSRWLTDPVRSRQVIALLQESGYPSVYTPSLPAAQIAEKDLPVVAEHCFTFLAWQEVTKKARAVRHAGMPREAVSLPNWRFMVGMVVEEHGFPPSRGVVTCVTSGVRNGSPWSHGSPWSRVSVALLPFPSSPHHMLAPTLIVGYLTDGEGPWTESGKLWMGPDGEGPRPLSSLVPVLDDPATGGLLYQMLPGGLVAYRDPDMRSTDCEWGVRCGLTDYRDPDTRPGTPAQWQAPSLGRAAVLEAWRAGRWAPPLETP